MHVFRSAGPQRPIPDCSITELVFAGLGDDPDRAVLIDGVTDYTLTAGSFRDRVQRLAGGLTERGWGQGAVVAIMAPNMPEFATVFHAVAFGGGTVTTINPSYTAAEVHHQLVDSAATLLVTIPAFLDTARQAADGTGVAQIAVIGTADDTPSIDDLMGAPLTAQVPVAADHVVVLPYSSGTTGLPKGVMLTHHNLVANVVQMGQRLDLHPGDRTLAFLPFFHIYGMQVLMNCFLSCGGSLVTLPRFDLTGALQLVQDHRIAKLLVAPPVALAFAKHPVVDNYDLSALTYMLSGAAPLGADIAAVCAARLGCEVVQGYGMTELSPVSHACGPGQGRPGSVGSLVADTLARLVEPETLQDVAAGEVGEIWIKGPQVMAGYLNNATATQHIFDADGWLRTGDLARVDADGYFYIVDRVKELIKVSGFQVAPAELEALIVAHPAVADVAVVGEPDEAAGEVPVAHIVTVKDATFTLDDLHAHLAGKVATYKLPRRIALRDTIPKSASGKILRRLLRAPI